MIFQRARLKTTNQINIYIYIWKITIVNHGSYGVNQLATGSNIPINHHCSYGVNQLFLILGLIFLNHQAQLPPRWIRIHWMHWIHRIHLPPTRPAICGVNTKPCGHVGIIYTIYHIISISIYMIILLDNIEVYGIGISTLLNFAAGSGRACWETYEVKGLWGRTPLKP